MFLQTIYTIKDADTFNPENYPEVVKELAVMSKGMAHIPIYYKENIVISYFKDHSIKYDWADANPKLAELITSNTFMSLHIESLFESCRKYKHFLKGFEDYIIRLVYPRN